MRASSGRGNLIEGGLLMVIGYFSGGIERTTGECFLVEVEHRDAATFLPIIQQYVRPGRIVYSDEWSSYRSLNTATALVHNTVNHSLHFVNPATHIPKVLKGCGAVVREC